jgi:hypothetical protein
LGVRNGDSVTLSQNGTSISLPVQVNRRMSQGVALLPRNLAGHPAEKLVGVDGVYATVTLEKVTSEVPTVEAL